ncbi:MAG: HAD family hydrolase [Chloroflexi bacterium]|jgi:HAD superfamily hydrolase (TIGR01490 family)|nr:HAD family hydrolase [Chloroflexota bacterium]
MDAFALALFDLDNTLLEGDCEALWVSFLYRQNLVDRAFVDRILAYYADYERGCLDIYAYEDFLLQPLAGHSLEAIQELRAQYLKQIRSTVRPDMQQRLDWHRSQGHLPLLITASNDFLAEPVARLLGFGELICTRLACDGERWTGKILGTPAFRDDKVRLLEAWLVQNGRTLQGSWAYSDSHNDLPLLGLVDHPVAVTPDDLLRQHALSRRWEILDLM